MGHEAISLKDRGVRLQNNNSEDFVLDKILFSNVFGKDIRRVYIYKKAERIAKAIRLISPAFTDSVSFKNRFEEIAVGLINASIAPFHVAREKLPQELLALSSLLSVLETGGALSQMNADLISREARTLLGEMASYEEPRLSLGEAPTLPTLSKKAASLRANHAPRGEKADARGGRSTPSDKTDIGGAGAGGQERMKDRRGAILAIIKDKRTVNIKDISTILKDISEKTVQRELASLIESGFVVRQGERRWSTYSLA